jgi:hypothetical protein
VPLRPEPAKKIIVEELLKHQQIAAELVSGQVLEASSEGDENAVFLDGQAEKECVRYLVMAGDAGCEGSGERGLALGDGAKPIVIASLKRLENGNCVLQCARAGVECRIRRDTQKSRLSQRTNAQSLSARGDEPVARCLVMTVLRIRERDQDVYIK